MLNGGGVPIPLPTSELLLLDDFVLGIGSETFFLVDGGGGVVLGVSKRNADFKLTLFNITSAGAEAVLLGGGGGVSNRFWFLS